MVKDEQPQQIIIRRPKFSEKNALDKVGHIARIIFMWIIAIVGFIIIVSLLKNISH